MGLGSTRPCVSLRVNSLGVCQRSVVEVKEKWRGMVSSAKKEHCEISTNRKTASPKKRNESLNFLAMIPQLSGISGGIESGK